MKKTVLGGTAIALPVLGLGCMGMSISYGESDDAESVATMYRAIELGCNLLVTSDAYGSGVNESLVARAIAGRRDQVLIATKFGNVGLGGAVPDGLSGGHPEYVRIACEASLKRLGTDHIDFYGLRRVDAKVPVEETVGAMSRLVEQGKARHLVLSEAGANTIRRAHAVHPITALETEYSLLSRDVEREILPACRELGIGFFAYAPLGRGFLTATIKSVDALTGKDRRREHPRFLPENINKNNELLIAIEAIASAHNATAAQVALAWLLSRGRDVVPIPGTKRRVYLEQNLNAAELELAATEIDQLDRVFVPGVTAGTRYPEKQMAALGI